MKFKASTFEERILSVQYQLRTQELKGAVISNAENIFYLSGHLIGEGSGPSILYIPAEGKAILTVSESEASLPGIEHFPGIIFPYKAKDSEDNSSALALSCFKNEYAEFVSLPLGIEAGTISFRSAEILGITTDRDWFEIDPTVSHMRMIKDADEIEHMRSVVKISDLGQQKAREVLEEGISEIELQAACRHVMEIEAGIPIEMKADVLFGSRTVLIGGPAGVAGRYRAVEGNLAIVDLLPRVEGYYADTTRTLWCGPKPLKKEKIMNDLFSVKAELEKMLKPGVEAAVLDGIARSKLSKVGSFPHHTGHGIGISSFEAPFITPDSHYVLEEGMTITLEPGVYFEEWGARIEDDYLITKHGFERLSESSEV
ncbi:MAG: aminopeptidase P family protein [Spirochaetota bacterium]|nr:MAG: aminopeptidase P family protein [Spirochaetota bacterium]